MGPGHPLANRAGGFQNSLDKGWEIAFNKRTKLEAAGSKHGNYKGGYLALRVNGSQKRSVGKVVVILTTMAGLCDTFVECHGGVTPFLFTLKFSSIATDELVMP